MNKINFDIFLKFCGLLGVAYILFLLTLYVKKEDKRSEIGRFKYYSNDKIIFDSKTGTITQP